MTPDQIQQFNMLQDVITEFSDNPVEKRSKKETSRCSYNPPINKPLSKGCAIGMYLTVSSAIILDRKDDPSIRAIFESESKKLLPKWMLEMNVSFLRSMQNLHDINSHWDNDNLSEHGKMFIKDTCNGYELPFRKLKFKKNEKRTKVI